MTVATEATAPRISLPALIPPVAALVYPFSFIAFHAAVMAIPSDSGSALAWVEAVVALIAMFVVPIASLFCVMALAEMGAVTVAQRRAMRVALLAIAAPPLHVFAGVVLYLSHSPVPLLWAWLGFWVCALAAVALAGHGAAASHKRAAPAWLRVSHGISALAIIGLFLTLHLANHLTFILGAEAYRHVMDLFRHVYRAAAIEPAVVALFLFQVVSGLVLLSRALDVPMDRFRSFQIGSGFFLAVYVLGHMNSVFVYQRWYAGLDSDWAFATDAPTGLLRSAGSIHLVPHYGLGVFFVLAHLSAGLRSVLLGHGVRVELANRIMIAGVMAAGAVAAFVMLGICVTR